MTTTASETVETAKRRMTPEQAARFWSLQLHLAEREHKDYWLEADEIQQRYKRDKLAVKNRAARRYNILYSNTETLKGVVYARTARPDVRRRYTVQDPVGKQVAETMERALTTSADCAGHEQAMKQAVHDLLLVGRGVVRVEYEPVLGQVPQVDPVTGVATLVEQIVDQRVHDRHIYWRDYLHNPARGWHDVWWVSYRHRMSRDDLQENFPDVAHEVPLNWTPDVAEDRTQRQTEDLQRAEVHEIWSKATRQRFWISKGFARALRIDDDPYQLEEFFPQPADMAVIRASDTAIPVPEFRQYRDLAEQLDENAERIYQLTKALKRRGVRDASIKELGRLARANDNEFIAVENYQALVAAGGLAKAFELEPIDMLAGILVTLHESQDKLEEKIDKLTGVSDIMRGEVDSREKLGQSELKAQYGSVRIKERQGVVQRTVRDLMRLKAEIIAEHFEPQVLAQMTGLEISPEVMQVLRDDKLRSYRIDIETDSTIYDDAEAEKASRIEAATAVTGIMQQVAPIMGVAPEFAMLGLEMMGFVVRSFKGGRQLEDTFDQARESLMQRLSNPQPQQPDPAMQTAQIKAEAEQQRAQADVQKTVLELQAYREKAALEHEAALRDHALDASRADMEHDRAEADHQRRMRESRERSAP